MGWRRRKAMIQVKTEAQIAKMRAAGLVVCQTLEYLRELVEPGISTAELDRAAEKRIRDAGAVPSFKGYYGFPASICASVNNQIVHSIPDEELVLAEGDVISIDCGAILDGWHGDSAITVPVGEVEPELQALLRDCEEAMWRGIAAMRDGGRLSDIGHAIESYVRSVGPYGLVAEYGGHGIGTEMHQEPHVPNHGKPGHGPRLCVGTCLAIEPMLNLGGPQTVVTEDGWTVETQDGECSAHFEHSVAITDDGLLVLTARDAGARRLADRGVRASAGVAGDGT